MTPEQAQQIIADMQAGRIPWDDNALSAANTALRAYNPPAFNFDYKAEAEKAYGELGGYYERLLRESQGDMNKVLSRLVEDYNQGIRFKREDAATQTGALDLADQQAGEEAVLQKQGVMNNALSRGLYQKSAFTPPAQQAEEGMGIASQNFQTLAQRLAYQGQLRQRQRDAVKTGLGRYEEVAGINLARQQQDIPEQQKRKEFAMEQERRTRAGELANSRASTAYNQYSAGLF